MLKKIFWVLIIVTLIILGFSGYYFYQYAHTKDAELELKAPSNILLGVPFDLEINFTNNSQIVLEDTKLNIMLPEDIAMNSGGDKRTIEENFGQLEINSSFNKKISLIAFEKEKSVKKISANVSYYSPNLGKNVRFNKEAEIEITAGESGVKFDLNAPEKVMNNESFELDINCQNNSNINFDNIKIELNYPSAFIFENSNISPSFGNNIWEIKNLGKGEEKKITIKGKVLGQEQSYFEIKGILKTNQRQIGEKTANINIAASPLSLNMTVNNQTDYTAYVNDGLNYTIYYSNNSDISLNDAIIITKLNGVMFDLTTLNTQASFNSIKNTLMWNAANTPKLRLLEPGAHGTVNFKIKTKSSYPIKKASDKNFVLKVNSEISTLTLLPGVTADKTISLVNLETKVAGKTELVNKIYYRDPKGNFGVNGSLPPKVNKATVFTVYWTIKNYSNDVKDAEVKVSLGSGVRMLTTNVKSNISAKPIYNERSQEITWSIGEITAGKGIINSPIEAIFQIEATPDITQVGQSMPLMSEATITSFDKFTNINLTSKFSALATESLSDLYNTTMAIVQQ